MKTHVTKPADVVRKWYVIDATDQIVGRLAVEIATILRGKKKPEFQPNVDAGDYVVVINAGKVRLTGAKEDLKTYFRASKYIGNHKTISFKEMKEKHPRRIIEKAVKGMIPHNALGRAVIRKLFVYAGADHRHEAQQPEAYELSI